MNSGVPWFSFAAPQWLAAIAGVLAPIAAHLWSRRLGPPQAFPAVRLMLEVHRRARPAVRLNDRWLLAMRCVAIALIACAFARPTTHRWHAVEAAVIAEGRSGAAPRVAVVLDASASMSRTVAGRSLFQQALDEATAMIQQSDDRIAWAVIIADERPHAVLPEPTRAAGVLIERLRGQEVRGGRARLDAAYRLAATMLSEAGIGEATDAPGALHVWTDGQAEAVAREGSGAGLPEGVRFVPHVVGRSLPSGNVAIRALDVEPARPVAGRSAFVSAELANLSDRPTTATLRFTGVAHAPTRRVELPANGVRRIGFDLHVAREATTIIHAELPEDGLAIDNRLGLAMSARPPIDIALLSRHDLDLPGNPAFYLARAIAPTEAARYRVRQLDPDRVGEEMVRPELLIALDPPALQGASREQIVGWIRAGSGMLQLGRSPLPSGVGPIDDREPSDDMNARGREAAGRLMPIDVSRPPWRVFEGEALATLDDVRFSRPLAGRLTSGAELLARWPDGSPALAAGPLGRGRIVSLASGWSEAEPLFASPAFVPFVQELLALAHQAPDPALIAEPGQAVRQRLMVDRPPGGIELRGPAERTIPATVVRDAAGGIIGQVDLPDSPQAIGLYRWLGPDGELLGAFTVRLDPRESDLRRGEVVAPGSGHIAKDGPQPKRETADGGVVGRWIAEPLWHWFIIAAALVLLAELAVGRWAMRPLGRSDPADARQAQARPRPGGADRKEAA